MPMTRPINIRVTLWMADLAVGALLVVAHAALDTGILERGPTVRRSSEPMAHGVARLEPGAG